MALFDNLMSHLGNKAILSEKVSNVPNEPAKVTVFIATFNSGYVESLIASFTTISNQINEAIYESRYMLMQYLKCLASGINGNAIYSPSCSLKEDSQPIGHSISLDRAQSPSYFLQQLLASSKYMNTPNEPTTPIETVPAKISEPQKLPPFDLINNFIQGKSLFAMLPLLMFPIISLHEGQTSARSHSRVWNFQIASD